ncbi:transposase IS110 [Alkalihalobacillus alcalophilus ATCC 27647 = CGMCC 1.3604]|uniref:Transposase IS110 n=1 Tax=Alkalihalobacillus alcalophilus ATCC 27647 = CGMCC 1.3604 TaxID=1218173 RepID=A0A4S4JVR8_ALKAL|nr:IS110 family transposase [Alkalihalobacillus alcalophilus]THG89224.1 transposase IS110 [Alkalihalobacillus alcalophilus ATCC 27647 = CGMCC 1.3604]
MNHTRNDRINQVNHDTLIIGIDIAKRKHFACAVDDRGLELGKAFPITQSREGFILFHQQVFKLMKQHQKQKVLIGFEPTGHYWKNLAAFFNHCDLPFVTVNPLHVKRLKEVDDNLQTKSDQKDARVIAKLMTHGNFSKPRTLEGIDAELRQGSTFRDHLKKEKARLINQIKRWTDLYFPEVFTVYKDIGMNLLAQLKHCPIPSELAQADVEALRLTFKQEEGIRSPSRKGLNQLKEVATSSIGLTEGTELAKRQIRWIIAQYQQVSKELDQINQELETLAKQLPDYEFLVSIPGVSSDTVSALLAETGSLSLYHHPRQLIKLAGLMLTENSSGQHKGRKKLSKRGRRRLRALLFRAILPLIRNNVAFSEVYQYYISRNQNPLKKKEALVILCSKLLKIFWGLTHRKVYFDGKQMRMDFHPLSTDCEPLAS